MITEVITLIQIAPASSGSAAAKTASASAASELRPKARMSLEATTAIDQVPAEKVSV